jgi:hypothetical protein
MHSLAGDGAVIDGDDEDFAAAGAGGSLVD